MRKHRSIAAKRAICVATLSLAATYSAPAFAAPSSQPVGEDGSIGVPPSAIIVTRTMANKAGPGVTANVAIVASASSDVNSPLFLDVRDKLLASTSFASVTVIAAGAMTPTVADLSAFDGVIVWSNFAFADPQALGDNLSRYVDSGGGVVVAVFANSSNTTGRSLRGRWLDLDYNIVVPQSGNLTGQALLGTVHVPSHPVMLGVSVFDGGSSSFRPTTTSLNAASTLIAEWNDGSVLVAAREDTIGGRVDLGFYPPSSAVLGNFWNQNTDGAKLLANALQYVANRTPLPPGDSDNDGDVDIDDYAAFVACLSIAINGSAPAGCVVFDFDSDGDVDCADMFTFKTLWTAPSVPPFPQACISEIPTASTWSTTVLTIVLIIAGSLLLRDRQRTA